MRESGKSPDGVEPPDSRKDADQSETVRRLPLQARPAGQDSDALHPETGPTKESWSAALDMVNEAVEAMRISEERAAELEAQLENLTKRYNEELRAMEARLSLSESRMEDALAHARQQEARAREAELRAKKAEAAAEQANARANEADARANDAEEWLARVNDAVTMGFSPNNRKS